MFSEPASIRPQSIGIGLPVWPGALAARRTPGERVTAQCSHQKVGESARVAAVAVWQRMDGHEAVANEAYRLVAVTPRVF